MRIPSHSGILWAMSRRLVTSMLLWWAVAALLPAAATGVCLHRCGTAHVATLADHAPDCCEPVPHAHDEVVHEGRTTCSAVTVRLPALTSVAPAPAAAAPTPALAPPPRDDAPLWRHEPWLMAAADGSLRFRPLRT